MAKSLPTYSASEVTVAWGLINFEGFSSDNIVAFAYNTDMTTETISCDGQLATAVTPDRSGTVTVELMQNSKSTRQLANLLAYQNNQEDSADIVKVDLGAYDQSGAALCTARNAYIKTPPEVNLGVDVNTHEWVFYSENIDFLAVPNGSNLEEAAENAAIVAGMVAMSNRA